MSKNRFLITGIFAALTIVAAGCTSKATPAPETAAPAATAPSEVDFDGTAAEEEGYWYSRYNLGNLVMRSGLGEQFMPSAEMMQAMMQAVDANPDDGDSVTPPANPALLHSVYSSADPHYMQQVDPADFGTQRWDPASFDTSITTRAMGWTIIKENEWAKQFHVDDHFGTIEDSFGAQWRFVGMVMDASSKMQLQYALTNLLDANGTFANSDGTVDFAGQWVMLEALSDVGGTLNAETLPHSASNRYFNPDQAGMFLGAADKLFGVLAERQPADVEETSLAIQALTWYAANTQSSEAQFEALNLIADLGDALAAANTANATEKAFAIRGLVEAYRTSGNDAYLANAATVFDALSADFNPDIGIFGSQNTYTIDNVGVIMGSLNSLKFYGGDAVDQASVEDIFTNFFLNAVNKSGLQQAVPPIPVAKGAFEQEEPTIFYGYPTVPMPPMAGGEFGVAPVFATEVSWDGSAWSVTNAKFDAAGAMHTSNEFIWFHNDEVNGFPDVGTVFDATAAEEEGYWYSRYNLLALTLQSGNGEVFMPDMDMVMGAIQMVDADPNDGDTATPPTNPAMLQVVYAGGDPHFTQAMDPSDFATLRWVGGDTRVTTEATAWTIVKELEWAKQFHVDFHFGTPADDFGAQQRFIGMIMALMPKMQVQAWMQDGAKFENSLTGDYALLIAFSDGAGLYGAEALPHSDTNRYADPNAAGMFADGADMLFVKAAASDPQTVRELSIGLQALVWYAANTNNAGNQAAALELIGKWGEQLSNTPHNLPVEHAFVVRGLIEAGRSTGDEGFLDAAAKHFTLLAGDFDSSLGIFSGQTTYTSEDVGVIMGSLNAARIFLGDRIDQALAESIFRDFFEHVVNLSGMQISTPPVDLFKAPFEQEEPVIFLRYPEQAMPPMAGGDFGIAPVLAASVSWDGASWTADVGHFDTAGAMHTINEFIWFHNDEVNGFPELP